MGEGPGRFYEPTVLTGVDHSMLCMTEETFGPTLPVMRVSDAEEAVELANDGRYGLQASVWTRDTERGEAIARRIEAGVTCVNDAQLNYAAIELPMGGWKESGLGSRHGPDGIRKYTKRQSILVTPGYAPPRELHMFPYVGEVTVAGRRGDGRLRRERALRRRPASHARGPLRHLHPVAGSARPNGSTDPTGFWARSASDFGVPMAVELTLLQAELPEEQVLGLRGLLDALAAEGMVAATPQEGARGDRRRVHGGPGGRGRPRRPPQHGADPALRAARPRHRDQPELARDGLPGTAGAAEAASRSSARSSRSCPSPRS